MAQVATSTSADPLAPSSAGVVTRDPVYGYLYVVVQTAAGTLTLYRSLDGGTSWNSLAAFTQTGIAEWSTFVCEGDTGHLAYRVSTTGGGGTDTIWYRRVTLLGASNWSAGLQTSSNDSNGGTAGATWQGVDLAAVKNSNGSWAIVVAGARTQGTTRYGAQVMGVSITAPPSGAGVSGGLGTIYLNNQIIQGARAWWTSGTAPGRSGIACETEHNGNGQTASTPNVWINWGRDRNMVVKLSWLGQQQGWQGPTNAVTIRTGLPVAIDQPTARWDGAQYVTATVSPDSTSIIRLYQRNRANTVTTTYDTPTHPQGVIRYIALSYDQTTRNPRVYAIGTSNAQIYWIDYTRATSTWGSWLAVNGATVLGPGEFGTRRGGTSGSARHDIAYGVSGSPNTIQHIQQVAVNTLPATATWNYAITPPNGGAADINAALVLAWTFSDPDPSQTQGAYALRRQIGTGTAAWWNAGTSTWGASEVFNSTTTQQVSLPSGWGADADPLHNFAVRVQDSAAGSAASYSEVLSIIPSVKANPTITSPTNLQVLTNDTVNLAWTVTEQTGYRITLVDTTGGGNTTVYDSGRVSSIASSAVIPYSLPNGTNYNANLTTYNNEGLASTTAVRAFSVAYAAPPAVTGAVTAVPASGWMSVTSSSLAPVGTQPAIVTQDLYRRVKAFASTLITGGDFNGGVTGFTGSGGTLTYSTTQSRSSPGSARLVPSGAAADSFVVSTTTVVLSATALTGGLIRVGGWVRPDTANKNMRIQINWLDAGGAFVSSGGATFTSVVAGAWQYLEVAISPIGFSGAVRAAVAIGLTGTPAAGDAFYADDIYLREDNGSNGTRAAQLLGPGATYNDWQAPGATDLEYRWVTKASNGTGGTGPWFG